MSRSSASAARCARQRRPLELRDGEDVWKSLGNITIQAENMQRPEFMSFARTTSQQFGCLLANTTHLFIGNKEPLTVIPIGKKIIGYAGAANDHIFTLDQTSDSQQELVLWFIDKEGGASKVASKTFSAAPKLRGIVDVKVDCTNGCGLVFVLNDQSNAQGPDMQLLAFKVANKELVQIAETTIENASDTASIVTVAQSSVVVYTAFPNGQLSAFEIDNE